MHTKLKRISIIGDGNWGTTLAIYLSRQGYPVRLWGPFPKYLRHVRKNRVSPKFLPGVKIPAKIDITENLQTAIQDSDVIVLAIPSQYIVKILKKLKKTDLSDKIFLSVVKGIDTSTLLRMSQVIHQYLGNVHFAVLSGPTIAAEVIQGVPTTAVIASHNRKIAKTLQLIFNSSHFRVYTNSDIVGVEFGGSLKNVIAIASGLCDGLKLGANTKAAILTRGLAEIARLGKALGAKTKTFYGLSGLGDLVTTCMSPKSRNRYVGEQLGKGKTIREIASSMTMIAEGIPTAKAVYRLSQKTSIPMPISTEVYNIIYRKKSPHKALKDLMTRKLKTE